MVLDYSYNVITEMKTMNTDIKFAVLSLLLALAPIAVSESSKLPTVSSVAPEGARVYIISPTDGQIVSSPVRVVFGSDKVAISPAGTEVADSGHHHLLIDLDALPSMDLPLPASNELIHFGKGQTETILTLEPGEHSLQLLLGNYIHVPHTQPVMSPKITILVDGS